MWPFTRKPALPPSPPDERSQNEKLGIEVRPGALTDGPGQDWAWVLGQFEGQKYWRPDARLSIRVRRKAWPIMSVRAGLVLPCGDGATRVVDKPWSRAWHIWRRDDIGDQSTFIGGLCVGWGGSLGGDHEPDDWVPVCGRHELDGTMYRPDADDLAATDWELA